ncbi:MAG: MBL fold metallo-hydrolase, partial [Desulfuromonadales bacterium]|nr:MBL fold metallo-hydrolase [Desulfuromonadales bacterium]
MLERDSWQALAGGNDARIFPFLRKPDITSCNSYLIETKQQIVLIDPGALPEQWDALMEQVSLLVKERARPVVIYLTHAHLDHSLSAISCQTPDDLMPIQVAIHQQGVAVLKQGDRKLSMAELYGCDFPCYEPAITLMANADVQEVATGAEAGSRPAHKLLRQCIDLGAGDTLEVYHTPGHSPDSVCYRLGEALFISDLLSATQPMVAGIIGWNRDEYIRSARHLL